MQRKDFHYELPPDRIALFPADPRDSARMLVCSRSDPGRLEHRRVRDLGDYLKAGDLMVLNETRVLPHRLLGRRRTGGRVECLILERRGAEAEGFLKPSARLGEGETLLMEEGALELTILASLGGGRHRFRLAPRGEESLAACLDRVGRAPLPPYIKRPPGEEDPRFDRERYQTVFAARPGAVAAPTAGLHLTEELLARLQEKGVEQARVTLHVGEGTFEPLRGESIEEHRMHSEWFQCPPEAAQAIEAARARSSRLLCVGTTSVRVLESSLEPRSASEKPGWEVVPRSGETDLFLYPGKGPRLDFALLTNFHLPESSLLLLLSSILGRERVLELYRIAIDQGYRFFSFGDAMLVLE
ncbi:MAG TPA: tRNA preQ1(34) S-adenosylmethionine ribosyltransferase-isomerase QueA [Planctomycetes bacterium]|nr:tRNA preQ1(34) S-adenosylmethionine ribosyltransferase-isomerase QueA [Planctomycetota bacterium]